MSPAANPLRARGSFSTYLDLLRFTAALLVVLEHSVLIGILPRTRGLTDLSHEAVVVFFVLSGLVVAASSLRPEASGRGYVVSRMARIYCVALPALAVCYGVMAITRGATVVQVTSSMLFLDGVWFNFREVPFNGPYWSLCYEVWYYVFWGLLLFVPRPRLRFMLAAAALVVMGPALAALAGIWLIGAGLAIKGDRIAGLLRRCPRWTVMAAFVLSIAAVVLLATSTLEETTRELLRRSVYGWWRMRASEYAVTDYLIGVLVAAHLVAALALFGDGRRFHDSRAGRAARYCAGFTFTLYLFHYPLLIAIARAVSLSAPSTVRGLALVAVTLAAVWLISFATERQLPRWQHAVSSLL